MVTRGFFNLWDMDRIIRSQGAERVGEDASKKLNEILEDSANELLFQARILARHAGRKQLNKDDVLLAAQRLHG